MSAKENVVPIDDRSAFHMANLEFCDWLRERFEKDEIATLSVCGIGKDGEPIRFDIVPINAETLRLMMIGLLTDAAGQLVAGHEPC